MSVLRCSRRTIALAGNRFHCLYFTKINDPDGAILEKAAVPKGRSEILAPEAYHLLLNLMTLIYNRELP